MVVYTAFVLNFVYLNKLRKSVFYAVLFVCDMTGSKSVYLKKRYELLDILLKHNFYQSARIF